MAAYLLDTNICICIAKKHPVSVLHRFEQLQQGEVVMSLITHGELSFGAEKSRQRDETVEKLSRFTELVPVLIPDERIALHYAQIRDTLERAGTPIGANNLWIAAHARPSNLILVSNNTGEFARVPDLKLENWV